MTVSNSLFADLPPPTILNVALDVPLAQHFDYFPPVASDLSKIQIGMRVLVPFRQKTLIGIIINIAQHSDIATTKLKTALAVLDNQPLISKEFLDLLQWASRYYHHPLGEVIATALPNLILKNQQLPEFFPSHGLWCVTEQGAQIAVDSLKKNQKRQAQILALLQQHPHGIDETSLALKVEKPRVTLLALYKKGWATSQATSAENQETPHQLNADQSHALQQIIAASEQFYPCLLEGVTGSGKTEVYLQVIQHILQQHKQALVLVPEINLTPQTVKRFRQRFAVPIAVQHSALSEKERWQTWYAAQQGQVAIVIGTRSSVWTPLPNLGAIIIDEEHDNAYKQQDHFRYSARDIAILRGQRAKIPVILGTATPALETFYNALQQRYHHLRLPERAGTALLPQFQVVDMRNQPRGTRLSPPLIQAIQNHLQRQQQILIFINRRGYAPAVMCYQCGWVARCFHCDANLTLHHLAENAQKRSTLWCHHCGAQQPLPVRCPHCQAEDLHPIGQGTERIEEQLQGLFPEARILRIDSDTTAHKHAMHLLLQQIHAGEVDILVGTQMLAKGHHFPQVTLVGIINLDDGLYSSDFRATERMAQMLLQVAGRAGRGELAGQVLIQTYHPQHPHLQILLQSGYDAFARAALEERKLADLPPFRRIALLRAEAHHAAQAQAFLELAEIHAQQLQCDEILLWGIAPAPMEKCGDWFRYQLIVQSNTHKALHRFIQQWLIQLKQLSSYQVRWSLDIDPMDMM